MPKITAFEYAPLKAFFVAWHKRFPPFVTLAPEHYPVAVLDSFERTSMSKARTGLGMAINDLLEMSWDFPPNEISEIDRDFASEGIVTLSELRHRYSRRFRSVLKRKSIRNEVEYYLVKGILDSFTANATDEECKLLQVLATTYESKIVNEEA